MTHNAPAAVSVEEKKIVCGHIKPDQIPGFSLGRTLDMRNTCTVRICVCGLRGGGEEGGGAASLLTPTKWRGQGVLRISSTGLWACPHPRLGLGCGNILPHHVSLWLLPSSAALGGSGTHNKRCQPTTPGWYTLLYPYPDPATDPAYLSLFGCVQHVCVWESV